ncbi:MAG: hypothetical protein JXA30_06145 [Deltaproteobacteria bacterium]|nr:hypothetical protein [Deltaproteobacteria bacterium]
MKYESYVFSAILALSVTACGNDGNPDDQPQQTGGFGVDGAGLGGAVGLAGQSSSVESGTGGSSQQTATSGVSGGGAEVAGTGTGEAGDVINGGAGGSAGAGAGGSAGAGAGGSAGAGAQGSSTLEREFDPVVLGGESLTLLVGREPSNVVAFRYDDDWAQIPVQVDERDMVDYYKIYNNTSVAPGAFVNLVYVDPGTLTGPDSDPKIDEDDEIVFMAHDAGLRPGTFSNPSGVVADSAVQVRISEPEDDTKEGYVYLFESDGSLKADAGRPYGTYTFKLQAGTYPANYSFIMGPNPEDTTFKSAIYERHYSDRFLTDVIKIFTDGATGVDILDVLDSALPDGCMRHVGSYNAGEGAIITNKGGAVRTIRGFMGANSGPLTEKTNIFYEAREDQIITLRVHMLPWAPVETLDYSPEAIGMKYYNVNNTTGVVIDGQPDNVEPATGENPLRWEMVSGPQGSLVSVHEVDTDITGLTFTSFYQDSTSSPTQQCVGDTTTAYGQSGPQITGALPSTDPAGGGTNHMIGTHHLYYLSPSAQIADAEKLDYQARNPLKTEISDVD